MPARKLGDTPVSDSGTSALPPPKSPVGRKFLTEGGLRYSRPRPETFSDGGRVRGIAAGAAPGAPVRPSVRPDHRR